MFKINYKNIQKFIVQLQMFWIKLKYIEVIVGIKGPKIVVHKKDL